MADKKNKLRREQLIEKYVQSGFESLSEHERLELLLIYAHCSDAETLAAELLSEYGSINALANAEPMLIMKNSRVSEHTAVLIRLISCISRTLYTERFTVKTIKDTEAAKKYFTSHFIGALGEKLIITSVSKNHRIHNSKVVSSGLREMAAVSYRDIADFVLNTKCSTFYIAHNHPHAASTPSESDIVFTQKISHSLTMLGAVLADHIIIGTDGAFSFLENGLLPSLNDKT